MRTWGGRPVGGIGAFPADPQRFGRTFGRVFWNYPLEKAGPIIKNLARTIRFYGIVINRRCAIGIIVQRPTDDYGPPVWERKAEDDGGAA